MTLQSFALPFENHSLRGDAYGERCNTIILHGAGKSSRTRFSRLREGLNANGIPTVSFDFIGHGETGGALVGSSLQERTAQAAAVIRHTCCEPLTLIGASMGAYTAIKLAETFSVANLILLVPAIYTPQAYETPFGPPFSAVIRVPDSWQDSDAFRILEGFKGNLLVIAAEVDAVIPMAVIQKIHAAARQAETNRLHIVPESRHLSLFPTQKDFQLALDMMVGVCRSGQEGRGPISRSRKSGTADSQTVCSSKKDSQALNQGLKR
ncbi:MAG: alpha/beta hydrolase [Desulfobacteraceae bacterium]|nr:alpha/beta hydrolase [Desulfobacteraceae bacterium]MBC2752421.1 alpha/beta fold hydrolase [Desulfobacteraceae bacterium]